jgi:endonuclease/exonuclease/phosphatase family metal-dependent hydrolase
MKIATFNVQNLRLHHVGGRPVLHGARDRDELPDNAEMSASFGPIDRQLTAEVLKAADADAVALQEVFDLETLDFFHEEYLVPSGIRPYPYRICLPGNDGRGYDVALMSRSEVSSVKSHASLTPGDLDLDCPPGRDPLEPVFRRDCLAARIADIMLFVCHFKAPYPDLAASWAARRLESLAVRRLIEKAFPEPGEALWLVLGDLNEPHEELKDERAIAPLIEDFAVDLVQRIPADRQWSFHLHRTQLYSRPDALLASPALARRFPDAQPYFLREGLGLEAERHHGARLPGVGFHRPHASDHAALVVDFKGL